MTAASHDPCLQYTPISSDENSNSIAPRGMTCLQTDDTFNIENNPFLEKEESPPNSFNGNQLRCFGKDIA